MEQEQAPIHTLTSLTLLILILGFLLNLCALLVFCDVPKLLKSTINTLVRNLLLIHMLTVLLIAPLVTVSCETRAKGTAGEQVSRKDISNIDSELSPCSAMCTLINFLRGMPISSVFAVLWIMALDRTMTIVFPKHSCTMYLKRNPNLVTLVACLSSPLTEAHTFLSLALGEHTGDCQEHSRLPLRYIPLAFYLTQVSALVCVCSVLLTKLRSAPPKYSTGFMRRIVLLVVTLIASYIICTAPNKISRVLHGSVMLSKTVEAVVLMPIVAHPIMYFLISVNFRKAMRRSLRRRTMVFINRYCTRSAENMNSTLSVTAFSITSEETLQHSTPNAKKKRGKPCACQN